MTNYALKTQATGTFSNLLFIYLKLEFCKNLFLIFFNGHFSF